jgi:hypothetical protein
MEGNKIKYSKEFKSFEGTEWIGVDVVVNEGEDWDEKWKEAHGMVHKFASGVGVFIRKEWPPNSQLSDDAPTTIPSIDISKEKTEIAIDNAGSLDELAKFKMQAEKYYLQQAYMSKMKQFV